ncbi:MAG TPA: Xaa-Pro dipeptidase [Woeseiaceae bacterium]|nr:Xaa-Pro dipeptidase [Woeseiaceae bacterium]
MNASPQPAAAAAAVNGRHYAAHLQEIMARHDRALEFAGANHAVIFSGAPRLRFLDDSHYPFTANPHFVGWLPLTDTPHSYLVYTPGETPLLIYFQEKDYWHAPPADPHGFWTEHFDIRIVHTGDEIPRHLPESRDNCILIGELDDACQAFGIERVNPTSALNILHYARAVKTAYELDCMRAASLRGARGHRAAQQAFLNGKSEYDIHLDYCRATQHTEHELPYDNIIALNEHGAVLHYQHQAREAPAVLRSFLIDAGARVNGYASDITRSYAREDDDYQALIERMHELQLELVGRVRAGVDFAALHVDAHRMIATLLVEVGLAAGSVDALLENGVTTAFFPHGLGHLLGIQVHDVGGFLADEHGATIDRPGAHPFLRLTRTLEPDQVLTIEPGLYAIDLLQANLEGSPGHAMVNRERLAWLRRHGGIRIEDNVRVLPDGSENLTRDAFAALR